MSEYKDIYQANTAESTHVILVRGQEKPTWHRAEKAFGDNPLADIQNMLGEHRYVQADIVANWADETGVYSHAVEGEKTVLRIGRDGSIETVKTHAEGYVIHDPSMWFLPILEDMEMSNHDFGTEYRSALRLGIGDYFAITLQFPAYELNGIVSAEMRNTLSIMTSLTGKVATTISSSGILCVCDNTTKASERGAIFSARHTKNSEEKRIDFYSAVEEFARTGGINKAPDDLTLLAQTAATMDHVQAAIEAWVPLVEGTVESQGGKNQKTRRLRQQTELWEMVADPMVAPTMGSALGIYQLLSTWEHYASPLRGTSRGVKNMRMTLGGSDMHDRAIATVASVLPSIADQLMAMAA